MFKKPNKQVSQNSNVLYSLSEYWFFVAPALIGTLVFVIFPILISFCLSFFEWDLLDVPKFVGIKNYIEIFTTSEYLFILKNTLFYVLCVTLFSIFLPLYLAYLIIRKIFGAESFKLISILPYITPMVVAGVVWAWIFEPSGGLVNSLFHSNIKWLYDKDLAMLVLIFVSVWKFLGYNTLLFITGFANINLSVIESAEIDGAGDMNIFVRIILPLIFPTIIFVSVVTVISSFQVFDLVYIMTQGGPDSATEVIVYTIFKEGFEYFNAGKSCALGYVLFLLIFLINLFSKILIGRKRF